jgi:RNA polymerase sigma-70 factor (ECF subfamily)
MLYDRLIGMHPSPIHELNRAIVVAQISGAEAGIDAINRIGGLKTLQDYHLLHATLGEFHQRAGRPVAARESFHTALQFTSSPSEQSLLQRKLQGCRW